MKYIDRHIVDGGHATCVIGWLLALVGSVVYLLTMEPTVSFWDCGEFIAVSSLLQVGHPPGAPFYQLLAHIFTLFSLGNPMAVAWWSNTLSALAGGFAVMFLYWTLALITQELKVSTFSRQLGCIIGALCYLFCDTAWFSATESEVYSLAMMLASIILWAMMRWYRCENESFAPRWLLLIGLLLGLGYCTHQLTLLTSPTLLLLFILKTINKKRQGKDLQYKNFFCKVLPLAIAFFVIGLTPYLIVPIRAAADTPINECHSGSLEDVKAYMNRDRYEKAPVYPRMWRHRPNDAIYAQSWNGGDTNLAGNLRYYGSYQLTYMYLRYLMWNFSGRYNDRQGYGSPQNGQFITGIPMFDRLLVGTAATPPDSLHTKGHNIYYMLPFLLGILGLLFLYDDRRMFWVGLTLFLMGGIVLSIYLNHPCYEPRERDYAYVLSFYAFCIFIGLGAMWVAEKLKAAWLKFRPASTLPPKIAAACLLAVPGLMAFQNWDDHNRSHRHIAHDSGCNILNSCDEGEQGTVLFCYGDNDTFPLWYLQNVEGERLDIRVENIGLIGWQNFTQLLEESIALDKPVYFTHYAYNQFKDYFPSRLQLEGYAYRLTNTPCDSVAVDPAYRHIMQQMQWQPLEDVYVDEVGCKFLEMYWRDIVLIADNLTDKGRCKEALKVLDKTLKEIPLHHLQDLTLAYSVSQSFLHAGDTSTATQLLAELRSTLEEQLAYYHTMPLRRQQVMPYTLAPREELYQKLIAER